jgi:hypothetical protein
MELMLNRMIVLNPLESWIHLFDIGAGPFSASVLDLAIAGDSSWYIAGSFLFSIRKIKAVWLKLIHSEL